MENINNFLNFCYSIGVVKTDTFQTIDLYEEQNMQQVRASAARRRRRRRRRPCPSP